MDCVRSRKICGPRQGKVWRASTSPEAVDHGPQRQGSRCGTTSCMRRAIMHDIERGAESMLTEGDNCGPDSRRSNFRLERHRARQHLTDSRIKHLNGNGKGSLREYPIRSEMADFRAYFMADATKFPVPHRIAVWGAHAQRLTSSCFSRGYPLQQPLAGR
jgi:hypothetical protein